MNLKKYRFGFIGGGNMAQAITYALADRVGVPSNNIMVSDTNADLHNIFSKRDIFFCCDNKRIVKECDIIFLAVKPQVIENVICDIASDCNQLKDKCFVSIAAGISTSYILNLLKAKTNVIRVMPNTPMLLGCGATAISFDACNNDQYNNLIKQVFESVGIVHILPERLMNEVICVNGSSPAYFYLLVDCIVESAVKQGINRAAAKELAAQTMLGSARMLLESDNSTSELIDKVCSKGGTTIEAVEYFRSKNIYDIVDGAMKACTNRAKELSK